MTRLFPILIAACAPPAATWHEDVAPIVSAHCAGCHTEGGVTFPLEGPEQGARFALAMAEAIVSERMPPWLGRDTESCTHPQPWLHDLSLSDEERDVVVAWADAGAPEGPADAASALPTPPAIVLEGLTVALTPADPYPYDGAADEVVCAVLDPGLLDEAWLEGVQIVPGDRRVAHHGVVLLDTEGVTADTAGWFSCFGGIDGAVPTFMWAPGSVPFETPAGSAVRLAGGSRLVVQMHYHPALETVAPTRPTVRLRYADGPPAREAHLRLLGNSRNASEGLLPGPSDDGAPRFLVPAGASGHTETMRVPAPGLPGQGYRIWSVGNHMHRAGAGMRVRLIGADPARDSCLLHTPVWDFDWHRLYTFDAPVEALPRVVTGDLVELACTYDNVVSRTGVRQMLAEAGLDEPVDLVLGVDGLDEMCMTVVGVIEESAGLPTGG